MSFSYSHDLPYRIELFGDQIESLREFNPEDQLSITTHQKIKIIPNINNFSRDRVSFLDHLPKDTIVWAKDLEVAQIKMEKGFDIANNVFEKITEKNNLLLPLEMYLAPSDFLLKLETHKIIEWNRIIENNQAISIDANSVPQPSFNKNFELLVKQLKNYKEKEYELYICTEQKAQIKRLNTIFDDLGENSLCDIILLGLHEGFIDHAEKLVVFTDHQIFERYHRFSSRKSISKAKETFTLKEIYDLQKGDFVVHIDHGIGEFSGLEKVDVQGSQQEAIRLIYKGGDILYVSIHSLHRVSKFSGKEGTVPVLNKLGSSAWAMAKQKQRKN